MNNFKSRIKYIVCTTLLLGIAIIFSPLSAQILTDLSITAESEVAICQDSMAYNHRVVLTNVGQVDYLADSLGYIQVVTNTGIYFEVPITESLNTGETLVMQFDSIITIIEDIVIECTLFVEGDDNLPSNLNNSSKSKIYHQSADNKLLANIDITFECGNGFESIYQIKNVSCKKLLAGQKLLIYALKDGPTDTIYKKYLTLAEDFLPNEEIEYSFDFSYAFVFRETVSLFIYLQEDIGSFLHYDQYTFYPNRHHSEPFLNTCADLDELYYELELGTVSGNNIIHTYKNENYLYTTGTAGISYPLADLDEESVWQSTPLPFSGILRGTVGTCLDLRSMQEPVLSFDLIQFFNDSIVNPPFPTSGMRVYWSGTENGELHIDPQEEGVLKTHQIPLPTDFVGHLELRFLNVTGRRFDNSSDFLDYDVNLIDNIQLRDKTVSVTESIKDVFTIFPNPSTNDIQFTGSSTNEYTLRIYDTAGRHLYTDIIFGNQNVDISHLESGLYFVSLFDTEESIVYTQRLVKL